MYLHRAVVKKIVLLKRFEKVNCTDNFVRGKVNIFKGIYVEEPNLFDIKNQLHQFV